MKILIELSYDGTAYSGWQVQPNADTIQERIENAIKDLTGETVRVTGSGRTDAGVHAKGQIAHFETDSKIPPEKFKEALNIRLPQDIRVHKSMQVDGDFHAVKSAKKKTYSYAVLDEDNAVDNRFMAKLDQIPDLKIMKKTAKLFVGEHNFKGFSATGGSAKTFDRIIYSFKVEKTQNKTIFTVTGNGFLYKMVRMLVGAVVQAGLGKLSKEEIVNSLKSGEKPSSVLTLPAKGLTLVKVEYPELSQK